MDAAEINRPIDAMEWHRYRQMRDVMPDAAESGRLLAAQAIANDPETRKRVEDVYGIGMCRQMYPEVYAEKKVSGVVRFLDRVRAAIPW